MKIHQWAEAGFREAKLVLRLLLGAHPSARLLTQLFLWRLRPKPQHDNPQALETGVFYGWVPSPLFTGKKGQDTGYCSAELCDRASPNLSPHPSLQPEEGSGSQMQPGL